MFGIESLEQSYVIYDWLSMAGSDVRVHILLHGCAFGSLHCQIYEHVHNRPGGKPQS